MQASQTVQPFDVARARAETPGCEHVTHFNNAGASLMPLPVLDTVLAHLRDVALHGGFEAAEAAETALERVYHGAAALLGCAPDEIALHDRVLQVLALVWVATLTLAVYTG